MREWALERRASTNPMERHEDATALDEFDGVCGAGEAKAHMHVQQNHDRGGEGDGRGPILEA